MYQNIKKKTFWKKFYIDIILFLLIIFLLFYGIIVTWSANTQNINIIYNKILQIFGGLLIMFYLAKIPPKIYEIWSPYLYFLCLILLILVDFLGQTTKGAQRWLDLGIIKFQPSEGMKIFLPLIIARYISKNYNFLSTKNIFILLFLIFVPAILILLQPDLGTAILIIISGLFILFCSGLSWKAITLTYLIILSLIPIFWFFIMHDYQRIRIKILLHPEIDPLGSGYQIIQSKIAIGSGGFIGKGWLQGTQSRLEFLPECHTDFIFSVIGEEFGFIGIIILLTLYLGIIIRSLNIAINTPHIFGKLVISNFVFIFFMYIFINISMTSGLLPIVGIPLPLISYGGSSLLTLMAEFGIIMSIHNHKKSLSKIL